MALAEQTSPAGSRDNRDGVKDFVLDTNVLLHNPDALFVFDDNNVIIPFAVIEELDQFKKGDDDLARNARWCIRNLDRLRKSGRLTDGVLWRQPDADGKAYGFIKIDIEDHDRPAAIRRETADNRIIGSAYALHEAGRRVVFITKDINARIRSDALGVPTEDFEAHTVDADRLYTGNVAVTTAGEVIDRLYDERMLALADLQEALTTETQDGKVYVRKVHANQFVQLRNEADDSQSGLGRRLADTEHLVPVTKPRRPVFGVMARNVEQTMAMDLLLDDEVALVTLTGGPGTGKTLLALAAGMAKVFQEERYDKLLVARPIVPMGRDIGYLPGEKDEKLSAWMQPIFDNLDYLLSTRGSQFQNAESVSPDQRLTRLLDEGKLTLEALTYIRGRSIPNQFMVVDEAQNLTPHEVKTVISRVGEGTKMVLTGDVDQIDNPYLDSSSNGLSYAVERLKGAAQVGHVTLVKSERSELASLVAARL